MINDFIIREAKLSDYNTIHELNLMSLGYDYELESTKENLKNILQSSYYKIFVAEIEKEVVGYIHGSNYDNTYSKPLKNIMGIAVKQNRQGNGIGRTLLEEIEKWAKEDGCMGVRLVSGLNRTNAHFFYKRCGYNQRKEQINFIKWF